MCEYLGKTRYFTPILHCWQWEIFSGKPSYAEPFAPRGFEELGRMAIYFQGAGEH